MDFFMNSFEWQVFGFQFKTPWTSPCLHYDNLWSYGVVRDLMMELAEEDVSLKLYVFIGGNMNYKQLKVHFFR